MAAKAEDAAGDVRGDDADVVAVAEVGAEVLQTNYSLKPPKLKGKDQVRAPPR